MWLNLLVITLSLYLLFRIHVRLRLSRAKHPSLRGHAKMSRRVAGLLPYYRYEDAQAFGVDGAPEDVARQRRHAFFQLATQFRENNPRAMALHDALEEGLSDVRFTNTYRVPFQFRELVNQHIRLPLFADASRGTEIRDIDGHWGHDLTGAYGVNLCGYDFYKGCMQRAAQQVAELGPVLGPFHPLIVDNIRRIKSIAGQDEVSFHMSGTEAVMQAVRLACYHTRRQKVVVFCGAYHGWWDGVQPGIGNRRRVNDVYTLKEMSDDTLRVLRTRRDIACVLVNPLQALNPNGGPSSDGTLVASDRHAHYDRTAYTTWLQSLREVCSERGILLIMDEVFLGFRLAPGGAQQYFGVRADMVTYGKTLGGGLPVGVVCGSHALMRRFDPQRPAAVCFARGTFNAHPLVMAAMNEFLRAFEDQYNEDFEAVELRWNQRSEQMNQALAAADLPLRVVNMSSVFTLLYTRPSRYNWMLQYYLRAQGLVLPWIGTGRFIFSHNYSDADFQAVTGKLVQAAQSMAGDAWWWQSPQLSNKSIKKQVLKEVLQVRLPFLSQH